MRFATLRWFLPTAAFAAHVEAIERWWDDFLTLWGLFDPVQRKQFVEAQRVEQLDADMIDRGSAGGYAAGCGSDES